MTILACSGWGKRVVHSRLAWAIWWVTEHPELYINYIFLKDFLSLHGIETPHTSSLGGEDPDCAELGSCKGDSGTGSSSYKQRNSVQLCVSYGSMPPNG